MFSLSWIIKTICQIIHFIPSLFHVLFMEIFISFRSPWVHDFSDLISVIQWVFWEALTDHFYLLGLFTPVKFFT